MIVSHGSLMGRSSSSYGWVPSAPAGGQPSAGLDFVGRRGFLSGASVPVLDLLTATRASTATYVNSAGLIAYAAVNEVRFDYSGAPGMLGEGARTNILLNTDTLSTQSVAVTAQAYTLSFYGTGSVTMSGVFVGTLNGSGAFPTRVTSTFTPTAGSLTLTVSGSVTFANLEAGAFASSYIPTTGTAVTRAADMIRLSDAALTAGLSATAGTWMLDFAADITAPGNGVFGGVANSAGSFNDTMYTSSGGTGISVSVQSGGVSQFTNAAVLANSRPTRTRSAFAYGAVNDFAVSTKAQAAIVDALGSLPATLMNRFWFLTAPWNPGGNSPHSTLSAAYFWPTRLVNSDLVALST